MTYAERTSFNSVDDHGREPWRIGPPAVHRRAIHRKGARTEAVSVPNRRGPSRHAEYAIQAERVWIKRVGISGCLHGEHDGAEINFQEVSTGIAAIYALGVVKVDLGASYN